ncbi:hypothetical protein OX283_014355 [Flavobacterium sp. SUN052]|uniref:hypothetical protein n=1 Tax=Flavobacterium sp. SUN052 TaxID=3002441 RepID=UPI00237E36C6|nr:hypothetical protein [Flavobacterium sp. SUN052]MEC4005850.1 hypothetical protein [Flavobacterium sp. SUN052]
MKKVVLVAFIMLISSSIYSQKKKSTKAAKSATALAKVDNLVAEVKSGNFQLTINENGKPKDAIVIKTADAKFAPTNCKLTSFKASGATLYLLTWTEITQNKTDLKTEDITTIYSNIYEITSKKLVLYNTQLTNHIVEKVFLDKLKNASETQEKMRREGFEFTLNPDGSVIQKNKTQQNNLVYDATKMEYVASKKK